MYSIRQLEIFSMCYVLGFPQNFFNDFLLSLVPKAGINQLPSEQDFLSILLNPCARMNCTAFTIGFDQLQYLAKNTKYQSVNNLLQDDGNLTARNLTTSKQHQLHRLI